MGAKQRLVSFGTGVLRMAVAGALLVGAPGCGEPPDETVDEASGAIVNGDVITTPTVPVVAVYHRNYDSINSPWWPHPCTGTVLNVSGLGNAYVLTARHCVTPADAPNQGVEGPALSPANIKISADVADGDLPVHAVQACQIFVPPSPNNGYLDMNETLDLALVRVCSLIPGLATASIPSVPVYMGSTGDLDGESLEMYGFGCDTQGETCSGGGVLRHSANHTIDGFDPSDPGLTGYDYAAYDATDGDNDAYVAHGDSGGPSFWTRVNSLKVQVGVHRYGGAPGAIEDTVVSRITTQWIQAAFGHLYVRPQKAITEALTRSGLQSGADVSSATTIGVNAQGSSSVQTRQWLRYEFTTRHIMVPTSIGGTTCLRRNSDNSLQMQTCSTSTSQKWWVTLDNQIRTSDEYCLQRANDASVSVAPCSVTNKAQKWYFDFDSKVAPVF